MEGTEEVEKSCACPECGTLYATPKEVNLCLGRHKRRRIQKGIEPPKGYKPPEAKEELLDEEQEFYNLLKDNDIKHARTVVQTYFNTDNIADLRDPAYLNEVLKDCRVRADKRRTILRAWLGVRTKDLEELDMSDIAMPEPEKPEEPKDIFEEDKELKELAEFDRKMYQQDMKEMMKLSLQERLNAMRERVYGKQKEAEQPPVQTMMVQRPILDKEGNQKIDAKTGQPLFEIVQIPMPTVANPFTPPPWMMYMNPFMMQPQKPEPQQPSVQEVVKEALEGMANILLKEKEKREEEKRIEDKISAMEDKYAAREQALIDRIGDLQKQLSEERERYKEERAEMRERELRRQLAELQDEIRSAKLDKLELYKELDARAKSLISAYEGDFETRKKIAELEKSLRKTDVTWDKLGRLADKGIDIVDMKIREEMTKEQPPPDIEAEEAEFVEKSTRRGRRKKA